MCMKSVDVHFSLFLYPNHCYLFRFFSQTGPAAFRLRSHPGTLYEPTVEKGRPVLQGPLAANELVKEVCLSV